MTPATLTGPAFGAASRRRRPPRGGACDEPPRLFGDEPTVEAPATTEATPTVPPAVETSRAPVASGTLADLVADTWSTLTAAAGSAACLACGAEVRPRWSAGSGVVGGRCDGCGTTIE